MTNSVYITFPPAGMILLYKDLPFFIQYQIAPLPLLSISPTQQLQLLSLCSSSFYSPALQPCSHAPRKKLKKVKTVLALPNPDLLSGVEDVEAPSPQYDQTESTLISSTRTPCMQQPSQGSVATPKSVAAVKSVIFTADVDADIVE